VTPMSRPTEGLRVVGGYVACLGSKTERTQLQNAEAAQTPGGRRASISRFAIS